MDILALKRQYANINLFEQSILSSSAEDLSQIDRMPYQFEIFGQDPDDLEDCKYSTYKYELFVYE
jgi:hypothetical protein